MTPCNTTRPRIWRKMQVAGMSALITCGLFISACGGSSGSSDAITWYVPGPTTNPGDKAVFAKATKIIQKEVGVKVKFIPVDGADYSTKMTTILAAHQPVDILYAADWSLPYTSNALAGAFQPLDDLIKKYGKDYTSVVPDSVVQAAAVDGKIYGLTGMQDIVLQPAYNIEKKYVRAAGYDIEDGRVVIPGPDKYSQSNIGPLLAKIKETPDANRKNFTVLFQYSSFFSPMAYGYWPLNPSIHSPHPFYVKMGTTEVSLALPAVRQYLELMRNWYEHGYQPKDAGSAQGVAYVPSQSAAGFNYTGGDFAGSGAIGIPDGERPVDVPLSPGPFYMGYNGGESISSTSKHPDQAMKVLNLFYKNADLMNLLTYGIKGKNYTVEDGVAHVDPKGGYVSNGCWQFGNCYLTYPYPPYKAGFWKDVARWNDSALVAPLSGFSFNSRKVLSQWDQLATVDARYSQPLFTGSMPVKKGYTEYVSAMKAAGSDDVIKEMQSQLDEYLSKHPDVKADLLSETYDKVMSRPFVPGIGQSEGGK